MTPAIKVLDNADVTYRVCEYQHDPKAASYGLEAAQKLNLAPACVFKTLVTQCDDELVVAIIPVADKLSLKALAKSTQHKKASMAEPQKITAKTGYIMGGVSPLGQKSRLTTVIDASAQTQDMIYVSAGKRGLEIGLAPSDLAQLTHATFAAITV